MRLTNPATIGAVCHLNLHKTLLFLMAVVDQVLICVNEKLVPFLPSNPLVQVGGEKQLQLFLAPLRLCLSMFNFLWIHLHARF
jgi:glycine cleavage system protein P-like pyridoxal-binding family